jgi:DNA-binding transcriptional LysR family regulator
MITLHKLKIFLTVCDRGSFNQAAQQLLLAQSVVSQHMQDLEVTLGAPLFERTSRGVQPTQAGTTLYDYAKRIFTLLHDAEREILQIGATQQTLSIAATPGVSVYLLPMWLQTLQAAHPTINVSLQTALTGEVTRDVLSGRYDLGFLEGELRELDQAAIGRITLRNIDYFVTVQAGHLWADRESIKPDELETQPFINRQPSSRTRRWLETVFDTQHVRLRTVAELDSPGAIKYALLNNMGVAILPDYAIARETERGEIILLRIEDVPLRRPLLMIWAKDRVFNPVQRAFIGLLSADFPALSAVLLQ